METLEDLKKELSKKESPFNWGLPPIKCPIDTFIQRQLEKCETIDDENEFKWTSFTIKLLLAHEFCDKMADYKNALNHIEFCLQHLKNLTNNNCNEDLFISLKPVLYHVICSTHAIILLKAGQINKVKQILHTIRPLGLEDNGGVLGTKAAVFIQYSIQGTKQALIYAREARMEDPQQAEWHFITGMALERLRRLRNVCISIEEIDAIELALELRREAAYVLHRAILYGEQSQELLYNSLDKPLTSRCIQKSKTFAKHSVDQLQEAFAMRPKCSSTKARVVHGMIRIRWKQYIDKEYVKQMLDELVQTCPLNTMVYHDLGLYYEQFEQNSTKAISTLQKAHEIGNEKAFIYSIYLKWINGFESEIIDDIQNALRQYEEEEHQAELSAILGVCYILIQNDWQSAVHWFNVSLKNDSKAEYLQNYRDFSRRRCEMLNVVVGKLRSMVGRLENVDSFLTDLKYIIPDLFKKSPDPRPFESWKIRQISVKKYSF